MKKLSDTLDKIDVNKQSSICHGQDGKNLHTDANFFGNKRDPHQPHPKRFLGEIKKYFTFRKIVGDDQRLVVENALKSKAAAWCSMMKYASPNFKKFKDLFLKQYFSESIQWETFILCTEAGKNTVRTGFQEHFRHWMTQLKYLDMLKIEEE